MISRYSKPSGADWRKTVFYVTAYVAVIAIGAFLLPLSSPTGIAIWVATAMGGLFWLISWHSRNFAYRCQNCGFEFRISWLRDFISPQGLDNGGWKYLKCPQCGRPTRAAILKRR